jgi:hypothetical protein
MAVLFSIGVNHPSRTTQGAAGDRVSTNPKIGPIQYNGGDTWTHALLFGSPAIDAGTNSGRPATDQLFATRPTDGNRGRTKTCNIGPTRIPGKKISSIF